MKKMISQLENMNLDLIFKISYMILGLLTFNSIVANGPLVTVFSYVLTALGGVCVLVRLINYKKYMQSRGLLLLILFLVSYLLSSVFTIKYGVAGNLKAMIWLGMQFFLLYAYDINWSKEKIKKEAAILSVIFVGYTFVFAVLSIGCFILDYYSYTVVNNVGTIIGFLWNRLWGFYSDPNRGAVYSLISIIISLFAVCKTKKASLKLFLITNIIVELMYMAFSDSRTGLVSAIAGLVFGGVLTYCKSDRFAKMKLLGKGISAIAVALCIVVSFMGLLKGSVLLGNSYMTAIHNPDSVLYYWMDEEKRNEKPNDVPSDIVIEDAVGRPMEDLGEGGDISNRRFAIWMSGVEVFTTTPLLGTSFRNIVPYAQEHLPETYISVSEFSSMHNMFVDVLVSQGLLGMVIFIGFMVLVLCIIFKRLFYLEREDYHWCMTFLTIIASVFVSTFFYSDIFYLNTANSVVVWIVLGYLVNYIQKCEVKSGGKNE